MGIEFKNKIAFEIFFQSRIVRKFIVDNFGYHFLNNEFEELALDTPSNLTRGDLVDKIARDKDVARSLIFDVFQDIPNYDYLIYIDNGANFILAYNGSTIICESRLRSKIEIATGDFEDLNDKSNKITEIVNDCIKKAWNKSFDFKFSFIIDKR